MNAIIEKKFGRRFLSVAGIVGIVLIMIFAVVVWAFLAQTALAEGSAQPPIFADELSAVTAQGASLMGGTSFPPSAWSSPNLVTMKYLGGRWWKFETNVAGARVIQIRGKGSAWSELYWTYFFPDGVALFELPEDIIIPEEGQLGVLTDQYAVLWHGNYSFQRGPQRIWPFSMQTWGNGLMLVGSTVEDEVNPERFTVWSYGEQRVRRWMYGEFGAIGLSSDLIHLPWGASRWQPVGEVESYDSGWHMRYPDAPEWNEPTPTPHRVPTQLPPTTQVCKNCSQPMPKATMPPIR
jgi:hypothetical protein